MAKNRDEINELTPEAFTGLKTEAPKKKAAGLKGVTESIKQAAKYMNAAEITKTLNKLNQKGGLDCPGCAWPDPDDDRSKLGEYCENGVKAIAEEATKKSIGLEFFQKHSVQELSRWSDFELGKTGRLIEPLILKEGSDHYEAIDWKSAFELIGQSLNKLASPDEAIFYTSGRTSNEAAFLYQLFVRAYGTNNLPDCSNMCHESSGKALSHTVGIGKGSVTLQDLHEAEVIIVMGQNPGTNHPRMLSALEKCKDNGGQIISVNPLPEAGLINFENPQRPMRMLKGGTKLTDIFLQVRANGDVPLLKAMMLLLLEEEERAPGKVLDRTFIEEKTEGFLTFIKDLKKQDFYALAKESGVRADKIIEAVELFKYKSKIIICWAMGLTQHVNAVDNIQEVVNLLLMKGAIGKPGAGTCPVRGHSNVQGDRTMGIWEAPPQKFLDSIEKNFGFEPPQKHGYAVVDAIKAMKEKKASVFVAMGGNFLSATPDTSVTAEALKNCDLTVQVSTKLNRSHLITGKTALILPCLGRTNIDKQNSGDQFVSVENSMGIVHSSRGILEPPSEHLLSEPAIVAGIAMATLGKEKPVDWIEMISDYDQIREAIEKTIPGFENYNTRVRDPGGFYLPNGAREQKFNTSSGKARFTVNRFDKLELEEGEFLMMTNRSHDQYNTTIYGLDDRYRGIYNERRVVMMNESDMQQMGLVKGDIVDLKNSYKGKIRTAKKFLVVPYPVAEKCVVTYFPEANVLVPLEMQARKSKTPASKSVPITIHRWADNQKD